MQINFPVDKADLKRYAFNLRGSSVALLAAFNCLLVFSLIPLLTKAFKSSVTTK